jgi:hypothetical protein
VSCNRVHTHVREDYPLHIWWLGDDGIDTMVVRIEDEQRAKEWEATLNRLAFGTKQEPESSRQARRPVSRHDGPMQTPISPPIHVTLDDLLEEFHAGGTGILPLGNEDTFTGDQRHDPDQPRHIHNTMLFRPRSDIQPMTITLPECVELRGHLARERRKGWQLRARRRQSHA